MPKLTASIDGQIYHGQYKETEDGVFVTYYGRTDKKRETWYIDDFVPYFYAGHIFNTCAKIDDVKKIEVKYPRDVRKKRDKYGSVYEADVPFTRRVLLDTLKEEKFILPKVAYFDFETDLSGKLIAASAMKDGSDVFYSDDSEKDILKGFKEYIFDVDIITSWSNFDYDVLQKKRAQIPSNILYVDLLELFKSLWRRPLNNYKLSTVARLVGTEKIDLGSKRCWDLDEKELREYNIRDTEVIFKLDKTYNIIPYYTYLAQYFCCELIDTIKPSTICDIALLKEFNKFGYTLHNKQDTTRKEQPYQGAYIFSKPGLYSDVSVWDFSSLYPSIILSANISTETFNREKGIELLDGVYFDNEREGVVPHLLRSLIKERNKLKKLYKETVDDKYDLMQTALKASVINAIYGQFGFPYSRIYNRTIAESITYLGRELIQFMQKNLEKLGFNVIYADTDSVFISDDAELKAEKYINDLIDIFNRKRNLSDNFNMEHQGSYDKCFIRKKKNYILFREPDEYIIKGMGIVRGDTSGLQKDIEMRVMKGLIAGESKLAIAEAVSELTRKIKEYDLDYIAIPKSLDPNKAYRVETIAMRAYKYTKENIGDVEDPYLIQLLYVKSVPSGLPPTNVIAKPLDENKLKGFKIDYDEMARKSISRIQDLLTLSVYDFA